MRFQRPQHDTQVRQKVSDLTTHQRGRLEPPLGPRPNEPDLSAKEHKNRTDKQQTHQMETPENWIQQPSISDAAVDGGLFAGALGADESFIEI